MTSVSTLACLAFGAVFLAPAGWAQSRPDVTIFAAASLRDALDELAREYERQGRGKAVISYAGSPMLARQIEKGAPADLFISADSAWMDYMAERGLVRIETRVNLLSNRLVLIAPAESRAQLAINRGFPLAALLGDRRLAMADPDSVPAGKYGRAALESLGVWGEVAPKVARAENVRAALALVARAETPFGIVYRTDALAERRVRIVGEFAGALHPDIVYPAAVVAASRSKIAYEYLRYLRSHAALAVWQRHGFGPGN
ncbi:MAG: molybdate ABC transporter substrate-binding protein [Burkholderiales bacterium]